MKSILLAALLTVSPSSVVYGQSYVKSASAGGSGVVQKGKTLTLRLGAVNVALPAPEGFDEAASQFERVRNYFSATEDPANEMVAVHLPASAVEALKRGESPEMSFYTKVSVNRNLKERDYSATDFQAIISMFEKQGVKLLDFNSPEMKEKIRRVEETANSLNETGTKMSMAQPQFLGEYERTPNTYGLIILARLSFQSGAETKEIPMLCAASFVMVKSRLIYVYSYRRYDSEADLAALKDFARKWTAQIVAANRA